MKRKEFLKEFLGALGAESIEWHKESDNLITGIVIYDSNDPEEKQEFCWHITEQEVPGNRVLELAKLLNQNSLLSIDQISVTREELREKYSEQLGSNVSEQEFSEILEKLEEIEVTMVDDGKETDVFFIHE